MTKPDSKPHVINDLTDINSELISLKEIADRELASSYGLTGMVYRPHLDAYMERCVKKAEILACLKRQSILPLSKVEIVSEILDNTHKRAKNNTIVEYDGKHYERRFLPLKLSKSGKVIRKWARIWLLQQTNGTVDSQWESQIREVWPTYFLIRMNDL